MEYQKIEKSFKSLLFQILQQILNKISLLIDKSLNISGLIYKVITVSNYNPVFFKMNC